MAVGGSASGRVPVRQAARPHQCHRRARRRVLVGHQLVALRARRIAHPAPVAGALVVLHDLYRAAACASLHSPSAAPVRWRCSRACDRPSAACITHTPTSTSREGPPCPGWTSIAPSCSRVADAISARDTFGVRTDIARGDFGLHHRRAARVCGDALLMCSKGSCTSLRWKTTQDTHSMATCCHCCSCLPRRAGGGVDRRWGLNPLK